MSTQHSGKTYVLTGVSSGVGAATAKHLRDAGAQVVGLDIKETAQVDRFLPCDLSNPEAIDQAVAQLDLPVDGLVNIAGIPGSASPELIARVNVLGLRRLTEALLPNIADHGAVVNVASTAGANWRARNAEIRSVLVAAEWQAGLDAFLAQGLNSISSYDFSKEIVILYTGLISSRERHRGVRVNSVSPGAVETPILRTFYETMGEDLLGPLRTQAGGRDARPEEIAGPIAFLLGRDSIWVNGVDLLVDGGAEVSINLGDLATPSAPLRF